MVDRLDCRPLIGGLLNGLRQRRSNNEEPPDWPTRLVLFGVPIVVAIVIAVLKVDITAADQLLAASALLVGALLTGFTQIASWRSRILKRNRKVDGIDIRALNEAAAHVLICLLVAVAASASVLILTNLDFKTSATLHVIAICLSAFAAGLFTYIAISMVIVTNLLWDAFMNEERDEKREGLDK